jgi:acyl-CoA thioester hydrolase
MHRDPVSSIEIRVSYAETDQMGVAYHGRYPVWLEMARTEHLRRTGTSYRDLEARGLLLSVTDLRIRFRRPARYDDLVTIRCWVRDLASRRVTFGYAVERSEDAVLLATAVVSLIALNRDFGVTRLPSEITDALEACRDPVRI